MRTAVGWPGSRLMTNSIDQALLYFGLGYEPIYIEEKSKRPRYPGWQSHQATEESIRKHFARPSNIGIRTGDIHPDGTCLIAIDCDVDDPEIVRCIEKAIGQSVPTKRAKKGATFIGRTDKPVASHKIYLYREGTKKVVIDVLCAHAQTVVPPSVHPEGKTYRWTAGTPLDQVPYEELPLISWCVVDEIRGFCLKQDDPIYALNDMEWRGLGGGGDTHDVSHRAVASMVARHWPDSIIHARLQRAKQEACEVAGMSYNWPAAEKTIQEWIDSSREKGFEQPKKSAKPSHGDFANLVISKYGTIIRRDKTRRDWAAYNGKFWDEGAAEEVKTLIRRCLSDDQVFRSIIDGTEAVMRWDASLGVTVEAWDRDKHYLNCPDGTYNLKTGERLAHDPAHFITRMTRVSPRFDYQDSLWVKAVDTWFGGDPVEIEYIQMLFGLFLTGETRDECVAMWIGKSGAGKSKMTDAMGYIMGDYAQTATDTAFLDVRYHPHLEEVARMRGKRLVFVHEVEGYLNLRRVKSIASGEATSASFKGKDSFEFQPEAKIWFVGNEAPPTRSSGRELQRRFHVYEFIRQIEAKDMDVDLGAKLRDEAELILGWAIHGALKYYETGHLNRSPHVIESSNRYFADADILEQWIEERCIIDGSAVAAVADLFDSHSAWAEEARVKATLDKGRFSQRLKAKGYQLERRTLFTGKPAVRVIAGLRLRSEDELPMRGVVQEHDKF